MKESLKTSILREYAQLRKLAERALEQTSDEAFDAKLGSEDNSIAILVKHLIGNMRSRWTDFLTTDGEKADRNRDSEFVIAETEDRSQLMTRWRDAWSLLQDALEPLSEEDFARTVTIRGESMTVVQACLRQLTHYATHVGQIVLLAKHHAGPDWKTLSVPRGKSEAYNGNPPPYLDKTT